MVAPHETTPWAVLDGAKQHRVPLRQRTSSWAGRQRGRRWEDIHNLTDEGGS